MKIKKLSIIIMMLTALTLVGCSTGSSDSQKGENSVKETNESSTDTNNSQVEDSADTTYPITIQHAFGETVIEEKPNNIVSIAWGNQDVPLALGVVPVGVSQANYGVAEGENLLPWTADKFTELGVDSPNVFKDTAGLDYEAISDAKPDIILAAYSGITQEEYDLLSQIAPVVAYPTAAWQTAWRDQILVNSKGIGMETEGKELVASLEKLISDKTAEYPGLQGKTAAFFYFNPSDLGKFYVYLPADPRAAYLTDLGLEFPEAVSKMGEENNSFTVELSAENADLLNEIDVIVAYGNEDLLKALQSDSLLSTVPAIKNGAVALIEDGTPLAASGTPSALSIPATIDDYLKILGETADKVK
ncbi:iron-siderophore ABC transporter substrate-binding protein [Anaerosporobacter sp.]